MTQQEQTNINWPRPGDIIRMTSNTAKRIKSEMARARRSGLALGEECLPLRDMRGNVIGRLVGQALVLSVLASIASCEVIVVDPQGRMYLVFLFGFVVTEDRRYVDERHVLCVRRVTGVHGVFAM